jgi:serine phosphatase RsbU (regulator of sigma subunit)
MGADGEFVVANAGHIPPYVDGSAMGLNNGLPLGIVRDGEYLESCCKLGTRKLTIVSDGVIEAARADGELFGFERTREISKRCAREIAEAAKAWGQNDDITVVTVRRNV